MFLLDFYDTMQLIELFSCDIMKSIEWVYVQLVDILIDNCQHIIDKESSSKMQMDVYTQYTCHT